jgi:Mrp family chromosome partitioning ATPase
MVTVIIGHYGSGKTNFACNLALKLAAEGTTAIADLDIVNPYFRTADYAEILGKADVKVIASTLQTSTLDIPSLTFDLVSAAGEYDNLIIDAGGDDEGAKTLGRYIKGLSHLPLTVCYVVNFRRFLTKTAEDALEILREIEAVSGVHADTIVNNTNLAEETDGAVLEASLAETERLRSLLNIAPDRVITAVREGLDVNAPNVFTVKIIVDKIWNKS